jgi:hypothetical protein
MRNTLGAVVAVLISAQAAQADEWVAEARYSDQAALQRAASHFQHVIVDRKRSVMRVEADDRGLDALAAEGLEVTIDTAATARVRALGASFAGAAARGASISSIPGFECYRTVEETYQTMDDLVANHPGIAAIDDLGPTWNRTQNAAQGYEMRAMRITNLATVASDPDRPRMVVFSSIHAREYAPAELDTRFAEWLVENYGSDPEATWLVDHNDFRLVLQANPDARKEAEQQIYWRKNVDQIDGNCDGNPNVDSNGDGIDLNRNFAFHWNITHGQGSDGDICGETYRGPTAGSEPETQNLMNYVAGACDSDGHCSGGLFPDLRDGPMNPPNTGDDGGDAAPDDTSGFFVDIHSNAALVLWPWGDTSTDSPNVSALQTLGRRIAWFNNYTPEQSNELYLTDGTTDDSMYGLLGVPSFTIETNGTDFFEDCASFESDTLPTNLAALRYVARSLRAPYELPAGPDAIDVTASPDLIVAGDPLHLVAHLDSGRFNDSNGSQVVHAIAGASATIDALPWDGTPGTALAASDGAFDAAVETATGTIQADTLALGRHLVYVQGTDDAAQPGTPNATFFEIADAGSIGTVEGRVTDHASSDPLAAHILLANGSGESHATDSDGITGSYLLNAHVGTFDLRFAAPHHMPQFVAGVAIVAGESLTQNVTLLPDCVVFRDDIENGGDAWNAQSPWVIATGSGDNTTHVWSTPNYGDGLDRSLTTAATYNLTGYTGATLEFDDSCDTEAGYDYGYAEISADGGGHWTTVYSCTGRTAWQSNHIDLPATMDGVAALQLRFRLQSDFFVNAPGWSVDNIRLAAGGGACLTQQGVDPLFADGFDP